VFLKFLYLTKSVAASQNRSGRGTAHLVDYYNFIASKCKVFIPYKKINPYLGRRNRRKLYTNFLHARFRPFSSCPCFDIISSSIAKTPVQSGKVLADGMRPDADRRGQIAFHDAILRLHLDVRCV
jgi:hypothetical protein